MPTISITPAPCQVIGIAPAMKMIGIATRIAGSS